MKIEISKQRILTACDSAIFAYEKNALIHKDYKDEHRLGESVIDHGKKAKEYTLMANLVSAVNDKVNRDGELTEEEFNLIKEYL